MKAADLVSQRLFHQQIAGDREKQPESVVRWLGAMQAQDYGQAVWAVGLRTRSATLADVEQAIADRKIVRTWPMRGTIHFVPAQDAKWMVLLSAKRRMADDRRRQEQLGLDEHTLERGRQLFYDALNGGRQLTRSEMLALLENAGVSSAEQRGYHILWFAALSGLICMGPMEGKQQTFVLLDEWAQDARDFPREEALAELAKRYFTSHGPATLNDFAWWTGLTKTEARAGINAARPELISKTVDGKEYWLSGSTGEAPKSDTEDIYLLPGFDEYLLGYTDRSAALATEHAGKVVPGGNGVFRPVIVVNGKITGTWQRAVKKNAVEITLSPFTRLKFSEEKLAQAAQQYSDFLALPLSKITVADGAK
jgi:hypothetical protein